jgi:hypothetical protein
MTTFIRTGDTCWRRDDERHENVLLDTARLPAFLAQQGVDASIRGAFGVETLPPGLVTLIGKRSS